MLQNIFRRAPSRATILAGLVVILIFRQSSSNLPHLEDARSLSNYLNNTIRSSSWSQISLDRISSGADTPAESKPLICPGCPNATAVVTQHVTHLATCPTMAMPPPPPPPLPTARKVPEAISREQEIMNSMREEGILVIFKTGAQELAQLAIHLGTTLRFFDQQDILLFSDMHDFLGPFTVHDSLRNVNQTIREHHPEFEIYRKFLSYHANGRNMEDLVEGRERGNDRTGWRLDKWKFIHMIEDAFEMRPNAKWYFFIETDTYVIWPNLVAYLRRLDHTKPLYLGSGLSIGTQTFGHGGSGYVISHAAMNKLLEPSQPEGLAASWDLRMEEHCCGDLAVAIALQEKGVPLTIAHPFFNGYKPSTFTYGPRNHWCQPAITMHHITHVDISDYWRYERQREMIRGTENLTLFSDLYHYFAEPHIRESRDNWDNLSHGPTYSKEIMERIANSEKIADQVDEEERKKEEQHQEFLDRLKETEEGRKILETILKEVKVPENEDAKQAEQEHQAVLDKLRETEDGRKMLELLLDSEQGLKPEEGEKDAAQDDRLTFLDTLKKTEKGRKILENLLRKEQGPGQAEKHKDGKGEEEKNESKDGETKKDEKGGSDKENEQHRQSEEKKENPTDKQVDEKKDSHTDESKKEDPKRTKEMESDQEKAENKNSQAGQEKKEKEAHEADRKENPTDEKEDSLDTTASDLFSRKRKLKSKRSSSSKPQHIRREFTELAKASYKSFEGCRELCASQPECFQFVYFDDTCRLGYSFRLGQYVDVEREGKTVFKSGWMVDKIRQWTEENACKEPRWEWY